MPSRKWHSKSRNGCSACKKRRVRCNLATPRCSHCLRRKETCHYPTWGPEVNAIQRVQMAAAASKDPLLNVHQLDWTGIWPSPATLLSSSFAVGPNSGNWDSMLAREVSKHQALQSSLRALTVLYQERFSPGLRQRSCIEAYTNHLEASQEFHRLLSAPVEAQSVSIVIFTMAAGVFQLRTDALQSKTRSSAEVMQSFRATALLIQAVAPLFLIIQDNHQKTAGKEPESLSVTLDPETFESFAEIQQKIDDLGDEEPSKTVLQGAVESMSEWLATTRGNPKTWTDFAIWPVGIGPSFIDLLAGKDQLASRMFGFWCQVMKRAPYTWFMNDWHAQRA